MIWGYQNGWFPEFLAEDENVLWAKLKFLAKHGLHDTAVGLDELLGLSEAERDRIAAYLEEHDLRIEPAVKYDYVNADDSEAAERERGIVEGLERIVPKFRSVAVFTAAGCGHRFDGALPAEEKLERLSRRLAPLAKACEDLGTPMGINNQGDFYIGDFVQLCERTPGLMLWIDTANIFWACEPIFPAFEQAAPYIVGTHWRDERVILGNKKPRGVLLENCVTGQGHVDLRRCYQVLKEKAPNPDRVAMQIELFPPKGLAREEALEQALAFCRGLA